MINRKYNFRVTAAAFIAVMALAVSCAVRPPSDLTKENIIPKPVSMTATGDYFTFKHGTTIYIQGELPELKNVGKYLAERLKPATGFEFAVSMAPRDIPSGNIYLALSADSTRLGEEGYALTINKKALNLIAKTPAGLFRGIQTIRQILPASIEKDSKQNGPWEIATGFVTDYPEYSYRGAMLDVARHFFGVDAVKKYIDEISYYKINFLHLHLSDDQGWRIEIKSWPNLTIHGGITQIGGGKGGYYTQEQYSDIVKYAQDRYITIVPEIDMPGHVYAALSSYAELNCDGKARDLLNQTNMKFNTFCIKKEITYKFIDDVVKELVVMTPGPYIHIGGDESYDTKKEDYIPFMEKVQEIVVSHGKQVLAWDDIAISKLKPGTIAQYWDHNNNAVEAVSKGAMILMSPSKKAYIDMQYDSTSKFGQNWAAYIEVDSAYKWDPAKMIQGVGRENIIGVEATLWSETISTMDEIEYLAFPRLPGIAEVGWTAPVSRDWNEYRERLGKHGARMKAMGIDYYPSKQVPWVEEK